MTGQLMGQLTTADPALGPIPCKRPRVTVTERADLPQAAGTYLVTCYVPACGFTYPSSPAFHAVKSDAEDQARYHRQQHREAVPKTWVEGPEPSSPEYDAFCEPCGGHRRTFATKAHATAWLTHHLEHEHRVAVCPPVSA